MTTRRPLAVLVSFASVVSLVSLVLLSLIACGGAIGENATSSPDAAASAAPDAAIMIDIDSSMADAATSDAGRPTPSTGVVWVHAEASSFDPRACNDPARSDFVLLGGYLDTQVTHAGLKGARLSAGAGVCDFGATPTTMAETYVFTGSVAAAEALRAAPPAPFHGTYITVPLVVKEALNVKFEVFVGDGAAHAFDDVWVHDGLDIDDEGAQLETICNDKASFDAAIATSAAGADVKAWLAGRSADAGYRLGYDATFTFDDGTTLKIPNAYQAAGGPDLVPCPNLVRSP